MKVDIDKQVGHDSQTLQSWYILAHLFANQDGDDGSKEVKYFLTHRLIEEVVYDVTPFGINFFGEEFHFKSYCILMLYSIARILGIIADGTFVLVVLEVEVVWSDCFVLFH